MQLIILLTFMSDNAVEKPSSTVSNDQVQHAAFLCLLHIFTAIRSNPPICRVLTEDANVPSLGHAVTVLLDGISQSDSQLASAKAMLALLCCLHEPEILAGFLPGIVSTLTKVLTPSTQRRRDWKVLDHCLQILHHLLLRTVGDMFTLESRGISNHKSPSPNQHKHNSLLSHAWFKATADQIKLALANINKLHKHERPEVRSRLLELNLMILGDCAQSLSTCRQGALEAAVVLTQSLNDDDAKQRLLAVVQTSNGVTDMLQSSLRDWTMSMSRLMLSSDDQVKEMRLQQIFAVHGLLRDSDSRLPMITQLMAATLFETVCTLVSTPSTIHGAINDTRRLALRGLVIQQARSNKFSSAFAHSNSQLQVLDTLRSLIDGQLDKASATSLGQALVPHLQDASVDAQVASMWVLIQLLKAGHDSAIERFLLQDDSVETDRANLQDELYTHALQAVSAEDIDWRVCALSLEALAMQAKSSGTQFRGELVDVLYPVLHNLGSDNSQVRENAIACLDIMASSCEYADVQTLIVSNVDYLVNAVALKLNAFDVSPQGPQVLLMMVRLAGPTLLPYLEDTIESIFAALEDYHGYPMLVELLFAVLKAMAEEGIKAQQLVITACPDEKSKTERQWQPITVAGLANVLRDRQQRQLENAKKMDTMPIDGRSVKEILGAQSKQDAVQSDEDIDPATLNPDGEVPTDVPADPAPKLSKTYTLLLKITELTQHYLSSSSPSLRTSLLALVSTTIPALAKDEDSFLPLVNLLWPELLSRLSDQETSIVASSLDTITLMCRHAGDFMRTRVRDIWQDLTALHTRTARNITSSGTHVDQEQRGLARTTTAVGFVDSSMQALTTSLQALLVAVVEHVGIDAGMFDAVLIMLAPLRGLDAEATRVLEADNADALWLAKHQADPGEGLSTPSASDQSWSFVPVAIRV